MSFLEPEKWGKTESVQSWTEAWVTRALERNLGEECQRALHQLMGAAKASSDPAVAKAWARWETLNQVADGLRNARSVDANIRNER